MRGSRGLRKGMEEVAQTIHLQVSKCKNYKVKTKQKIKD
jgi:hypothetical protein